MRKLDIIESNSEPNINSLWFNNGELKYFGPRGWTNINQEIKQSEIKILVKNYVNLRFRILKDNNNSTTYTDISPNKSAEVTVTRYNEIYGKIYIYSLDSIGSISSIEINILYKNGDIYSSDLDITKSTELELKDIDNIISVTFTKSSTAGSTSSTTTSTTSTTSTTTTTSTIAIYKYKLTNNIGASISAYSLNFSSDKISLNHGESGIVYGNVNSYGVIIQIENENIPVGTQLVLSSIDDRYHILPSSVNKEAQFTYYEFEEATFLGDLTLTINIQAKD